jgi:putative ABC transport system permease protein
MKVKSRWPVLRSLVLRPLLREKLRTVLTLLGIAVGIAVLVAIQLANDSALRAFTESVDAVAGKANFQVVSDAGTVDESTLLRLQPLWASGIRFAPVIDVDATLQPQQLPIRILGVDLLSDLHFREYRYASVATDAQSRPRADEEVDARQIASFLELFSPGAIVLPAAFAAQHGLTVGSSVTIDAEGRRSLLTVRGLLESHGPATAFNGSLIIADISVVQQTFGLSGKLSRIDLLVPGDDAAASTRIGELLPAPLRVERPSRRSERVGKMLRAFRVNLFALASVALLVGIFLVYNTVLISVLRRRRDVGVLKTLGVSPGQIFFAFVSEGAIFGLVGSLLGVALGYGLAFGILDLISRTVNALYVATEPQSVAVTLPLVVMAVVTGVGVSAAAAMQPALEASSQSPNAMIRPGLYQRVSSSRSRKMLVASLLSLFLAAALSRLPAIGGLPLGGYASVIFILAGFSLLAPAILTLLSRVSRRPFRRFFGPSGQMAAATLPGSLRRTAIATAALAISIGMMVAIAIMVGSFRETVRIWVSQTVQSDLWLRPARGLSNAPGVSFPAAISEDLKKLEFIAAFDRVRGREVIFRGTPIFVGGADMDVAASEGSLPMVSPRSSLKAMREAIAGNGVLISESLAVKFEVDVGDPIDVATVRGVKRFSVTGIYRDYSNDRGAVVMPRPTYIALYDDDRIDTIAIFLKEGVDPDAARVEIEKRLGAKYRAFAFTNAVIRSEVMRIFDQTFMITYALLALSLIVSVLGIINTLSALILERKREIALLRILGTLPEQIRTMVVLESALVGVAATLLGVVVGIVLSWILIFVINKQSFGWTIQMDAPVALLIASVSITFVTTVLAGLVPARMAQRVKIGAELKAE